MSDAIQIDALVFELNDGGAGVRFSVSNVTASAEVPRADHKEFDRIIVTNPNGFSVFVRVGQQGVQATLNCKEIMPGLEYTFRLPLGGPQRSPWIAAITELASHTGKISAVVGKGI